MWRCVSSVSTVRPSGTSIGLPLIVSCMPLPRNGCGRRDHSARRVPFARITEIRFEGSRAAPGSQESSPHDEQTEVYTRPARACVLLVSCLVYGMDLRRRFELLTEDA